MNTDQNNDKLIQDMITQLDNGFSKGVGHVNVDVNADTDTESKKDVQTMGCTDCSRTPLACSVPTLHQGLDDYQ